MILWFCDSKSFKPRLIKAKARQDQELWQFCAGGEGGRQRESKQGCDNHCLISVMTMRSALSRRWHNTDNQKDCIGKESLRPVTQVKLWSCAITELVAPTGWVNFYRLLGQRLPDEYAPFPDSAMHGIRAYDQMISGVSWQSSSPEKCPNWGSASEPLCLACFVSCVISLTLLSTARWYSDPTHTSPSTACQPLGTRVLLLGPLPGSLLFPLCWEATLMSSFWDKMSSVAVYSGNKTESDTFFIRHLPHHLSWNLSCGTKFPIHHSGSPELALLSMSKPCESRFWVTLF